MSAERERSVLIVEAGNPAYFDLAKRGFNPQNIAKLARSHAESIQLLSDGRVNYGALVFDLDAFGTTNQIREALKEARYYGEDIPIIARTEPQDRARLELDPIGSLSLC